jgi:GNAT superfamily N-acetyltransferase
VVIIRDQFVFNKMVLGEEKQVAAMIKKVFKKYIASDYTSQGVSTFLQFINPAAIYSRNFRGNSVTFVCRTGDRIVGVLEIQGWKHILLLFVDSEFHRRGISRELISRAAQVCRKEGQGKVTVNASPYGEPIYKKLGFIPTDSQQERDGIKFTPMELVL